jgi:hypothetical protein
MRARRGKAAVPLFLKCFTAAVLKQSGNDVDKCRFNISQCALSQITQWEIKENLI